ncbi:SCO family protein [Sulfitobacter sp. S190]|uniref:SCO family protein n=1 Tax=Sulfitobacter sp. S190 TaxID=2867022 RepID=UPI0021A5CE79|nr:SCO family protein [Sulfitobacter sp. S190]UWR23183.1 SCO family protein [Sulfitobacter sp. S190]
MRRAALLALALAGPALADSPLPFDVGGAYALTDQHGQTRTHADPDGHAQLVFFGYANCPGICTAAMPLMADVTDALAAKGVPVSPVMITVDPARDTVDNMGAPLAHLHPDFVGLTGDPAALAASYEAFNVDHEMVYDDPEYGPIYSHGSLIYLMDGAGDVLTVLPPILDAQRATDIAWKYLAPRG